MGNAIQVDIVSTFATLNFSIVCLFDVTNVFFNITTNPYISGKNKDNDTKLSVYRPWGLPRSFITFKDDPVLNM